MTKYGIVVGSIKKNSYSEAVAKSIVKGLPTDSIVTYLTIKDLPLYNQDYDEKSPDKYIKFRKEVADQDAFIFVTPEHNRSIPAALKNALDIASRPFSENAWANKPALVASQSVSGISGALANHVLRQSLVILDMPTMQQPDIYIGHSNELFDGNLNLLMKEQLSFYLMLDDNLANSLPNYV